MAPQTNSVITDDDERDSESCKYTPLTKDSDNGDHRKGTDSDSPSCSPRIVNVDRDDRDVYKFMRNFAEIDATDVKEADANYQPNADNTAMEFRTEQQNDKTLQSYWTRANAGSDEFKVINNLLYKRTDNRTSTTHEFLLVVPEKYQNGLIQMAHDNVTGGHMGISKTRKRLEGYYF